MRKFFDFNGDGNASLVEKALGFGLIGAMMDEAAREEAERLEQSFDADPLFDLDIGGGHQTAEDGGSLERLQARRAELEEKMSDLELEEPDDDLDSPAYSRWEELHDELQDQIDDLELEIDLAEGR